MSRLVAAVFAVLVVATFAAFFVAQKLKTGRSPDLVGVTATGTFSPNGDGRAERARMDVRLRQAGAVTATVVDEVGDEVRTLAEDRPTGPGGRLALTWDGRDEAGRRAPDGRYRVRLDLRRQGRGFTLPRSVALDTTPPRPRVLSIGPFRRPGPELVPTETGESARVRFFAPGRDVRVELWRTDRGPRRVTTLLRAETVPDGIGLVGWDGRVRGARVGSGTFRVVVRSRDEAGNLGTSPPRRSGITVRYLAAQPPLVPVRAGRRLTMAVDARGTPFRWSLRRVGAEAPVRRGRRTSGRPFAVGAPGGQSGLFLFTADTDTRRTRVPVAVDDRRDHRVLVVLPATTWQGRNPVDDDGDGLPDTLDRGVGVRLARVFAGDGLPAGMARGEAPTLAFLDRQRLRYDLTTDVALAAGQGPRIEGHRGVLIAGDARWLTDGVRRDLRGFAARGGTVVSLGVESLRREVRQTPRRLVAPTPPAPVDLFGARIAPLVGRPVDLTNLEDSEIGLFAGEEGLFADVAGWEATESVGREAERVATAVTPDGRPVIVAVRYGRGLVVRPGIAAFGSRLSADRASAELLRRAWTLLSR